MKVLALFAEHVGGARVADFVGGTLGEGFEVSGSSDATKDADLLGGAEVILTALGSVTAEHIAKAGHLRLIQCTSHGFDHVDVAAAAERGIPVCNVGTTGAEAHNVAEHTFLLMLALAKRLVDGHNAMKEGRFPMQDLQRAGLTELATRTLGIVGLGTIGREVAKRGAAFGMRLIYSDPAEIPSALERELGAERRELDGLLAEADFVTIHVPLMESTHHLIDSRRLALMKKSAFLVNTARGAIVDQAALADALSEGRLAGAGIDVFDPEPTPPDHPLIGAPGVVLSPHVAGVTRESVARIMFEALENVRRLAKGEEVLDVVNGVRLA